MDECCEYFPVASALIIETICVMVFSASVISVFYSHLVLECKVMLVLICVLCGVRHFYSSDRGIVALVYHPGVSWSVCGASFLDSVLVKKSSVVTRFVSVIYLAAEGKTYTLIFLGGAFESFCYRRLRYLIKVH